VGQYTAVRARAEQETPTRSTTSGSGTKLIQCRGHTVRVLRTEKRLVGLLRPRAEEDCLGHANITTTSRYVRTTPVRLAQALERMEAAAETVVDADDQPHLAAVR
jgi:hypothetical protein